MRELRTISGPATAHLHAAQGATPLTAKRTTATQASLETLHQARARPVSPRKRNLGHATPTVLDSARRSEWPPRSCGHACSEDGDTSTRGFCRPRADSARLSALNASRSGGSGPLNLTRSAAARMLQPSTICGGKPFHLTWSAVARPSRGPLNPERSALELPERKPNKRSTLRYCIPQLASICPPNRIIRSDTTLANARFYFTFYVCCVPGGSGL